MIMLWLALALILPSPYQSAATPERQANMQQGPNREYEAHRQAAIQLNELAGRIHSEADAREFADAIANIFAENLPPAWAARSIRNRIAHAEYETVAHPSRLIPEQRIADVWNEYAREIGAPDEALVNAAEIHNMRDAAYAGGQMMWRRGNQTIWTMPNIYAVSQGGKVADGCRAVEALRVIYEIDNLFDNVRSARQRLQKGIVASDLIRKSEEKPNPSQITTSWWSPGTDTNPIRPAEYRYIREQGADRFNQLLERLSDALFPPEN